MKITKRILILLILVLVIVLLSNMVGCSKAFWALQYKGMRNLYERDYGKWSWEKRYGAIEYMGLAAALGGEEFDWLDLPVEKIKVDDAAGVTPTCGDH